MICSMCTTAAHDHCVVHRFGQVVCGACAQQLDFEYNQHMMQHRMMGSAVGMGRMIGAGGQVVGQAAGAIAAGTIGGAVRLATGAASGAAAALHGLRSTRMSETPRMRITETPPPTRPRALLEYDISDAGSHGIPTETLEPSFEQQMLEELRKVKAQMAELQAENDRLKQQKNVESLYSLA